MTPLQRPVQILLVEDSPGDVWLTREILMQGPAPKQVHVAADGEVAIRFLRRQGEFSSAPRPDLVLLDLNLPRRNGLDVLRDIKSDPSLRAITIIVLTTSESASDINAAYDLNANCYVVKPVDLERYTAAIQGIEEFWLKMAMLPRPGLRIEDSQGNGSASASSGGPTAAVTEAPVSRCVRDAGYRFRETLCRRDEAAECSLRSARSALRARRGRGCIGPANAASARRS